MTARLEAISFPGPAGRLEGLWKDAEPPRRGAAVFAHPHPLFGGTLHSKVVYRSAKALVEAGFATLRFNFRGVGLSEGLHDEGRGETQDVRAALDEAARRGGAPLVAGGFSFGSAAALRAAAGDARVEAFVGVGLPVATPSAFGIARPPRGIPAIFVVGDKDTYGPPDLLREFIGSSARIAVISGADHFFEGRLDALGDAIGEFLKSLPVGAGSRS